MLIGLGLVKKVVIADYLARTIVDPVFGVPQAYSAPDAILAAAVVLDLGALALFK